MRYLALIYFLAVSCGETVSKSEVKDEQLASVLENGGGLERWRKIDTLSFVKVTNMYLPDSMVESSSVQRQTFSNYPEYYGEIVYLNDSKKRRIVQRGNEVAYYENGKEISDSLKLAKAATNIQIAYYVIGLPFKLADQGVNILSTKNDTLYDDRTVWSMHVKHDSNEDQNWWLYFEHLTKRLKGYLIEHDERFSEIINDRDTIINGFTMPLIRRSIATDQFNQNPYLRADYEYSEYKIKVKE